jgi:hypothetical protein
MKNVAKVAVLELSRVRVIACIPHVSSCNHILLLLWFLLHYMTLSDICTNANGRTSYQSYVSIICYVLCGGL